MELMDAVRCTPTRSEADDGPSLDHHERLVLDILEREEADDPGRQRRRLSRATFCERGTLQIVDPMGAPIRHPVLTRDANQWGVGFITRSPLLPGFPAVLQVKAAGGELVLARGCVLRCREVVPGWFEGAIQFQTEQSLLSVAALEGGMAGARPRGLAW